MGPRARKLIKAVAIILAVICLILLSMFFYFLFFKERPASLSREGLYVQCERKLTPKDVDVKEFCTCYSTEMDKFNLQENPLKIISAWCSAYPTCRGHLQKQMTREKFDQFDQIIIKMFNDKSPGCIPEAEATK